MRGIDYFIDDFQAKLSLPVAMRIAENCREKKPDFKGRIPPLPLMDLRQFSKMNPQKREETNLLSVVLGPFGIIHDEGYSYWQGIKVVVGNSTVVAVLCRLNTKKGTGCFLNLKLWDIYDQKYSYFGDPGGERNIHPNGVIKIVCDHMSAQYHVGFVEDNQRKVHNDAIINSNKKLLEEPSEDDRRKLFEKVATGLHRK
jgi:hypothetical protein